MEKILTLPRTKVLESQFSRKSTAMAIFITFFSRLNLFDVSYHNCHVWMEIVLQI